MSFREQRAARPGRAGKLDGPVTPGRVAALGSLILVLVVVLVVVLDSVGGPSFHSARRI